MIKKIKEIISPGIFPFTICFFLVTFIFFYRALNLPSPLELSFLIEDLFGKYGLWFLSISAFLEGVFIVGMYFPGSLAIALAVYTLGKSPIDLFYIGSISFLSFLLANIINYYLGKYGYYKFLLLLGKKETVDKMQSLMVKHGSKTFFFTGFFPNFIAITSVCAGISNLKFSKTIMLQASSLLFWVTIWTMIGSLIVEKIDIQNENQSIYILLLIFSWGVFLVIKKFFEIRFKKKP